MATKFLRLRINKATRIFAIIGIVLALWLNAYFPIIGVGSFAHRIILQAGQDGLVVDYPRFLAVIAAVDSGSSVTYHRGKRDGSSSLLLYMGDLDANDVEIRGISAQPHIFLVADCGRLSDETSRQARGILQKKPFDETAFRKLPLTSVQRAVLKLQFWGTPVRIIGIPAGFEIRPGIVDIRFRPLFISSCDPAS